MRGRIREAAGPLVDFVRIRYLLRALAKLRLAADVKSAATLVRLAAASPRIRRRKPELATRAVSIRLRELGGNRVVLRPATTDYDVLLDTFLGRYHLEPVSGTPGRILDLGANIGLTMAHYAHLFPAAQIVGVELDDRNVALCRENIAPYGARCTVLRGAVWTEDGEITYRRTGGNEWGFAVGDGTSGEEVAAPAMTVAAVLGRSGWDWVDFVKMDVEGVERALLERSDGWIDKVGSIGVEVHPPYSVEECERDLRNLGFRTSRLARHPAAVLGERPALMPDSSGSIRGADLVAPAAVHVVDLDGPLSDLDLRSGSAPSYRRVLVVGRSGGRVVGAEVFEVPASRVVASDEIAARFSPRLPHLETAPPGDGPDVSGAPSGATETEPDTTVVITTCGGDMARLRQCLESVRDQTIPPLEVVVVNNRPKVAALSQALVDICAEHPEVRCIEESKPGLSRARNAGLCVAQGKYVAFLDDDVIADARWLAAAHRRFAEDEDVACVTGLILPDELLTPAQVLFQRFAGFGKGFAPHVYNARRPPSDDPLFPYTAGQFGSGANCMFDRSALLALAGFDSVLGAGTPAAGGEDIDMFLRIITAGHTLVYEPGAVVWHRHPRTYGELRSRAYSYGVGLGAMLTKQALFGRDRRSLWRKAPLGLWYLLNPQSEKNRRKEEHFPIVLTVRELLGFCAGPYAYLKSRARMQ